MTQSQPATGDGGRRPRRLRRLVAVVAVVVAVAVIVPSALGGTGVGAVFNLGRTNTVNSQTTLKGSLSSSSLRIENAGSGSGLSISTKSTVAPLRVSSKTKVPNLNADLLDGVSSESFVRASGPIVINASSSAWLVTNSAAPVTADFGQAEYTRFQRSAAGYNYLRIGADLPVGLFGEQLALTAVEVCYGASATAELSDLWIFQSVATNGRGTTATAFSDTTNYTDEACRRYSLATPLALATTDVLTVRLGVSWEAGASFYAGRTSFFLAPTGGEIVGVAGAGEVTVLEPGPLTEPAEDE